MKKIFISAAVLMLFCSACAFAATNGILTGTHPDNGGAGTPGGTDGQIQYNNNGAFGGLAKVGLAHGGTNADLSATGGASYVLKQSSTGAAITVGQLATSNLSDVLNDNDNSNIFMTYQLPTSIVTPSANGDAAFGNYAMTAITTGSADSAFGTDALQDLTTGTANSAIGYDTLLSLTTGSNNTALGQEALDNITTGSGNTQLGSQGFAGTLTTGSNNTIVGYNANITGATATNQISLGYNAIAPANNTAQIGNNSITDVYFGDTTALLHAEFASFGASNTALGTFSENDIDTGADNTAVGYAANYTNTVGNSNTAVGNQALYSATSSYNTAVGDSALHGSTTGGFNTCSGAFACQHTTTGNYNTAYGYDALNTGGNSNNTALGYTALQNATASSNTGVGYAAGYSITTGTNNTILGYDVANGPLTTGSNNILIGVDITATTAAAGTSNTLLIKGTGTAVIAATNTDSSTVGPTIAMGGQTKAPAFTSSGTKFTTSGGGCTVASTVGGATAGQFTANTTGTCTTTITMNGATGLTAPNGWTCWANDITTGAAGTQTASSATTATIAIPTTSGNTVSFGCMGY